MICLNYRSLVCLLVFSGLSAAASASSWTCEEAGITRQVIVSYPEAPALLPCKVFYAKPEENALPRALWESNNTHNYCEQKAVEFVARLGSLGWRCSGDRLEEQPHISRR